MTHCQTCNSKQALPNYSIYDIDGVFNPHMATDLIERQFVRHSKDWIDWHLDIVNHAAWVREIEDYADIIWGSNWETESNALAEWFQLKETQYPHIPLTTRTDPSPDTWKLPSISKWIVENVCDCQKVVWIDDELCLDAFQWAAHRPNVLFIKTDASVGITREHVESIKSFFLS